MGGYDMKHYAAGIAANASRIGTFGLAAVNFDTGFRDVREYAISGAYGFNITDRIALGTTLKFVRQDFLLYDGASDSGTRWTKNVFAFDLGAYFATGFRNTVLAMSVENISADRLGETEQFELPKNIRLGVLLDVMAMMGAMPFPHALDLVLDVNRPNYGEDDIFRYGRRIYLYAPGRGPLGRIVIARRTQIRKQPENHFGSGGATYDHRRSRYKDGLRAPVF